jgi:hypothetical protein
MAPRCRGNLPVMSNPSDVYAANHTLAQAIAPVFEGNWGPHAQKIADQVQGLAFAVARRIVLERNAEDGKASSIEESKLRAVIGGHERTIGSLRDEVAMLRHNWGIDERRAAVAEKQLLKITDAYQEVCRMGALDLVFRLKKVLDEIKVTP